MKTVFVVVENSLRDWGEQCQAAEQFDEYAPDVVDGLEFYALTGGVGLYDAGTDAGYLDAGIVLYEEACLEDEVHSDHMRTPAQHVVEGVAGQF